MAEPTPRTPSAPSGPATPSGPTLPAHVTTPLLSLITDQALDQDYQRAAERRAASADHSADDSARPDAGGGPSRAARAGAPALAAATVLGLLLAVAAVETSADRGVRESGRASLVEEAGARRDVLAAQQSRLADLREANLADSATLTDLADRQRTTDERLGRLRTTTGYGAVSGPGVRVVTDGPPDGDPADDMTLLLDGLWNAGAEAVSVNGRRITAVTRVASTGPAVSIDGRSLALPYTVLAIGDPDTLQSRFAESSTGAAYTTLAGSLLFDFEISNAEDLELPAAALPARLSAQPASDAEVPERSGS